VVRVVQAVATLGALYFAWKALEVARATRGDAMREKARARIEQMRAIVGEIERLSRWGGTLKEKELQKERLSTLLRSFRQGTFPSTEVVAHWNPKYEGAEDQLEDARAELDKAIDAALGLFGEAK
jgi:hypothetical protein